MYKGNPVCNTFIYFWTHELDVNSGHVARARSLQIMEVNGDSNFVCKSLTQIQLGLYCCPQFQRFLHSTAFLHTKEKEKKKIRNFEEVFKSNPSYFLERADRETAAASSPGSSERELKINKKLNLHTVPPMRYL